MLFLAQHGFRVVGTRSSWPWPIQPGLVRKRHEWVHGRSGRPGRGPRSQGHHDGGPLDRRRRSRALHRTVRHEASGKGGPHRRRSAAHVEVCGQCRTDSQSNSSTACAAAWLRKGPLADLPRLRSPVLWRQQTWCAGVAGDARSVLALEHAGRPQERVQQHQGLFETDFTEDLKKLKISRPWSCTVRTTRSFPSRTRRRSPAAADQGGRGNLLSGPAARSHRHACRRRQPRPARVLPARRRGFNSRVSLGERGSILFSRILSTSCHV